MLAVWPLRAHRGAMETLTDTRTPDATAEVVDACIVGGGPAGMMCGLLLARQGLRVAVLEKHADFLRDFRGDTVHPSTLDLLEDLGLGEDVEALPHRTMPEVRLDSGGRELVMADFRRLPTRARGIAFVPQWDLLDLLARAAQPLSGFTLHRSAEVTELLTEGERVVGVRATTPEGPREVRARLVIGCDGRDSRVRRLAGLRVRSSRSAMDVLWLRLPRHDGEPLPLFTLDAGILISIDRGAFWQIALAVPAGTVDHLRTSGIAQLHERIARARPELAGRATTLGWEDIHPLRVRIDHLPRWHRSGLLCIGDAAHAMSPAGGVGVNLAIQDAVATARMLGPVLAHRTPSGRELDAVRRRRLPAARVIQLLQSRMLSRRRLASAARHRTRPPLALRVLAAIPPARHLLGRLIGVGLRPEHLVDRPCGNDHQST